MNPDLRFACECGCPNGCFHGSYPTERIRPLFDFLVAEHGTQKAVAATLGMSEKGKAAARRHMRKQLREQMRGGVKSIGAAAKKVKEKVTRVPRAPDDEGLHRVQFVTACNALGMTGMKYGKRVDPDRIRENKRAAAKLFHPDRVGNDSKREQFQTVLRAAEWLEAYNTQLEKK